MRHYPCLSLILSVFVDGNTSKGFLCVALLIFIFNTMNHRQRYLFFSWSHPPTPPPLSSSIPPVRRPKRCHPSSPDEHFHCRHIPPHPCSVPDRPHLARSVSLVSLVSRTPSSDGPYKLLVVPPVTLTSPPSSRLRRLQSLKYLCCPLLILEHLVPFPNRTPDVFRTLSKLLPRYSTE